MLTPATSCQSDKEQLNGYHPEKAKAAVLDTRRLSYSSTYFR